MRRHTLVYGMMLVTWVGIQSLVFPLEVRALNCCPCSNPCASNCYCRGSNGHCPTCRADESGVAATFGALAGVPGDEASILRRSASSTFRFLGKPEYKLAIWCPQANKAEEDGMLRAALTPVVDRG